MPKRLTTPWRRRAGTPPRVSRGDAQFGTGSRPNQGLEERQVRVQRLGVPLDADARSRCPRSPRSCRPRRGRRPAGRRRSGRRPGGGRSSPRACGCGTSGAGANARRAARRAWPASRDRSGGGPGCAGAACRRRRRSAPGRRGRSARIGSSRASAWRARLSSKASRLGSVGPSSTWRSVRAVGRRVEVGAAGQADAVQAVEQRREVIGADRREHDGDRAGRVERAQVGHPERHLGVRGLAVPARRRHRAGAKLRSRHADQRPHIAMIGSGPD